MDSSANSRSRTTNRYTEHCVSNTHSCLRPFALLFITNNSQQVQTQVLASTRHGNSLPTVAPYLKVFLYCFTRRESVSDCGRRSSKYRLCSSTRHLVRPTDSKSVKAYCSSASVLCIRVLVLCIGSACIYICVYVRVCVWVNACILELLFFLVFVVRQYHLHTDDVA